MAGEAFGWALLASSSLVLGGVLALTTRISPRTLGLVMAFGSGILISAIAFELITEATRASLGEGYITLGLLAGALTFYLGDRAIDRLGGRHRKRLGDVPEGTARGIVLGTILDGIPESIVIGLTLTGGGEIGIAVVAAVFLSNVPEAVAASLGLHSTGRNARYLLTMWAGIALLCAVSATLGFLVFDDASPEAVAVVNAFAAGAILTMLAVTMIPEAYEQGGRVAGLATTIGFAVAFALSGLD